LRNFFAAEDRAISSVPAGSKSGPGRSALRSVCARILLRRRCGINRGEGEALRCPSARRLFEEGAPVPAFGARSQASHAEQLHISGSNPPNDGVYCRGPIARLLGARAGGRFETELPKILPTRRPVRCPLKPMTTPRGSITDDVLEGPLRICPHEIDFSAINAARHCLRRIKAVKSFSNRWEICGFRSAKRRVDGVNAASSI